MIQPCDTLGQEFSMLIEATEDTALQRVATASLTVGHSFI